MEEAAEVVVSQEKSTCAWCNKETALALFGIGLGLLFIAMSVDTLRRMRMSTVEPNLEHYLEGGTVDD